MDPILPLQKPQEEEIASGDPSGAGQQEAAAVGELVPPPHTVSAAGMEEDASFLLLDTSSRTMGTRDTQKDGGSTRAKEGKRRGKGRKGATSRASTTSGGSVDPTPASSSSPTPSSLSSSTANLASGVFTATGTGTGSSSASDAGGGESASSTSDSLTTSNGGTYWEPAMAQMLYESSKGGVFMLSSDMIIKALNTSAQLMFGYFPKEIIGSNFVMLLSKHYHTTFNAKLKDFLITSRHGDLEEFRDSYCERKTGDQFYATIRIINNLNNGDDNISSASASSTYASTSSNTTTGHGLIVSVYDDSDFINLQSRTERRIKDLLKQVETKESILLKAQAKEEQELLHAQQLKSMEVQEKQKKKKEFLGNIKLMNEIKQQIIKSHTEGQYKLNDREQELKDMANAMKANGDFNNLHKAELDRLNLLFEREAQDLLLRQKLRAEEIKLADMRLANEKLEKQLKQAQELKAMELRDAQQLRRFMKQQRTLTKAKKSREIADLRERQIEEIEAIKRRHRQELFHVANSVTKESRKLKYEQAQEAAMLSEQRTKHAAELLITQQREAQQLKSVNDRHASLLKAEQDIAANNLSQNQNEIQQMLTYWHEYDRQRFEQQVHETKHFELLSQNCSDVISLHSMSSGLCIYVSPSCKELLGFSEEEFQKLDYHDLVNPENRSSAREAMKHFVDLMRLPTTPQGSPPCMQVFRVRKKDGMYLWVERTIKVATKGELLYITHDISDLKNMEELQHKAEKHQSVALNTTQAQRDFLAYISHECRNPLNALYNIIESLGDTGLSDQQCNFVDIMKSSCTDMLQVLNDLLDLSKLEAGKVDIELIPFNFCETINQALAITQALAMKKGIIISSFIDPSIPETLVGDVSRIKQILVILLSNSIKHTETGEIHLDIHVNRIEDSSISIKFEVVDTGTIMDKEVVTKFFTIRDQIDASDYRNFQGGSGIGLRLCALLIQQSMGGTITLNNMGAGNAISFIISFCDKK